MSFTKIHINVKSGRKANALKCNSIGCNDEKIFVLTVFEETNENHTESAGDCILNIMIVGVQFLTK